MRSCDTCIWFVRIKSLGLGICDYDDSRLDKILKQCKNYKSKKYNRKIKRIN